MNGNGENGHLFSEGGRECQEKNPPGALIMLHSVSIGPTLLLTFKHDKQDFAAMEDSDTRAVWISGSNIHTFTVISK